MIGAAQMEDYNNNGKMHPKKFSLVLLIVGMTMLFLGLTSAFLVREAEGNWLHFSLPPQFVGSTIAVIISSLSMYFAYYSAKRDNLKSVTAGMAVTLVAGLSFVYFQYLGFNDMADRGIYFSPANGSAGGLVSGSFVIMFIALHLLHLLGGIIFVTVVLVKSLILKVHKKNTLSISMCNTYWHFVGVLWIYLYLFLNFAPQL
ncbi:MAG: cytochrome c oxidase subunit 3 [Bacteroidetes bacterium]|jgi:cytochrome c oxidase subunit 3|nr:cytochrome c oxidase subunit 3 [Bacteroidota bacterium]